MRYSAISARLARRGADIAQRDRSRSKEARSAKLSMRQRSSVALGRLQCQSGVVNSRHIELALRISISYQWLAFAVWLDAMFGRSLADRKCDAGGASLSEVAVALGLHLQSGGRPSMVPWRRASRWLR